MFGLSLKDKAVFFRQLATLIDSGMPVMGCLEAMRTMPNSKIRNLIEAITPKIIDGQQLHAALSSCGSYFDPVEIQLIKAGEVGGNLEIRLQNIADYLEKMNEMRQQLISRLIYPIVLVHAGIFIPPLVLFIVKGPLAYFAATLIPLFTLYGFVFAVYFIYNISMSVPGLREAIDGFILFIPFLGLYFKKRAAYRFMLVLGDMTEAGVEMELSVDTAAEACGNAAAQARFKAISKQVATGSYLEQMLRQTGMIPEICLQMVHTGEQSGNLPFMLKKAAEMLRQELEETTKRVFTILPVLFYFLVAIYAGYIIITTFAGIYAPIMNQDFP